MDLMTLPPFARWTIRSCGLTKGGTVGHRGTGVPPHRPTGDGDQRGSQGVIATGRGMVTIGGHQRQGRGNGLSGVPPRGYGDIGVIYVLRVCVQ
jgi:hypothetical protein